jgi:hypothetical protein
LSSKWRCCSRPCTRKMRHGHIHTRNRFAPAELRRRPQPKINYRETGASPLECFSAPVLHPATDNSKASLSAQHFAFARPGPPCPSIQYCSSSDGNSAWVGNRVTGPLETIHEASTDKSKTAGALNRRARLAAVCAVPGLRCACALAVRRYLHVQPSRASQASC